MSEPVKYKRVRAVATGFWHRLIQAGWEFEVPESTEIVPQEKGGWFVSAESNIYPRELPAMPQLGRERSPALEVRVYDPRTHVVSDGPATNPPDGIVAQGKDSVI